MSIARIRTVKEAYAEIKQSDPKTAITLSYVRRIAPALPGTIKAGNRFLINLDELESYIGNPERLELDRQREYQEALGKIRAVRA